MKDRYVATVDTDSGVLTVKGDKLEDLCRLCDKMVGMTGYRVNDTQMYNWQVAKYGSYVPEKFTAEKEVAVTTIKPIY